MIHYILDVILKMRMLNVKQLNGGLAMEKAPFRGARMHDDDERYKNVKPSYCSKIGFRFSNTPTQ